MHRLWIAALAAWAFLIAAPALGAQATYTTPTVGPMSMSTYVTSWLNPALAAALSNNSGATAPAVTGQPQTYQWWVDTSASPKPLRIYDGTSWLAIGSIDTTNHAFAPIISNVTTATGLTATGASQGTALAINKEFNNLTTVAASTGVILPGTDQYSGNVVQGYTIEVANNGANSLNVYPPTSQSINGGSANAAVTIYPNGSARFTYMGSLAWLAR